MSSSSMVVLLILLKAMDSMTGQECPTWFQFQPGTVENGSCKCGSSINGAVLCDTMTGEVSLALGYCMTYSNISGGKRLVVSCLNYDLLKDSGRVYAQLPDNVTELNDFMCRDKQRSGFLCGECMSDYGYAINSVFNKCAKCNTVYAVCMFILCALLPITICFVLIILLRLNIPSGFLCGYILYCQCYITAIKCNSAVYLSMVQSMGKVGRASLYLSLSLAGLSWYFIGIFYFLSPICIHHKLSGLQVILLEYVYFIYPLLLLFLTWLSIELYARNCKLIVFAVKPFHMCLFKLQRNWSVSNSVIHAYATFFFLSFLNLVYTSFSILSSAHVYDMNFSVVKYIPTYEPSMEWFSPQHLQYAIPAILILFLLGLCPTLLLCLHTTHLLKRCITFRPRTQLKLNAFVDVFQNCFKDGLDGTYDFRFLSSLPMFFTLFFFSFFPSNNFHSRMYIYSIFALICLIVAFLYAFLRPYKTLYMNFSLCFHFATVAALVTIVLLWYEGHIMSDTTLASALTVFSLLPHLLAIATVVYRCLCCIPFANRKIETLSGIFLSLFRRSSEHELRTPSLLPDRLENSSAYNS